ncbi:TIGR00730 family Rossman fold protein [Bailinhaonella thermotolerans]|uniref:Adenylosuccinate synthetase n=1 Tax=Bailinhaonella thermotolerans TaxID=1070861 RepID=A0A3A4A1K9_9ACTN|nr:TIGR00730 family Rossman fold protein [Bailinhaonella thermotolerans]RJL21226.1 TIGR00730 family Rossman fold protein [Bailinhaonella thermotolerans]
MKAHASDFDGAAENARRLLDLARASRERQREKALTPLPPPKAGLSGPGPITWIGDLQQGDGGKGAMVDRLAPHHDLVVRVQGGDNAGHTVVFRDASGRRTVLKNHLIPSGMRHRDVVGVIGNGVLVNPATLAGELEDFRGLGVDLHGRLLLSDRAHLVMPLHQKADALQEGSQRGIGEAIGTTRRGIGPANVSKHNRTGIRVRDLTDMDLVRRRLRLNTDLFGLPASYAEDDYRWLHTHRDLLMSLATDTAALLTAAADAGYGLLFEGAQGPLIDIDHGIYPYVTTCPTAFHAVPMGTGVDAGRVQHRIAVLKAYQTMVGNGPFVTEDTGRLGTHLRERGAETGTTTGRPRRCGWLDLVHAHWSVSVNRPTSIVLTKLDVLDGLGEIGVCVGYQRGIETSAPFRPEVDYLRGCAPVLAFLPGWPAPVSRTKDFSELPAELKAFVRFIANYLEVPVSGVSVGPDADDLIAVPGEELAQIQAASSAGSAAAPAAVDVSPRSPGSAAPTARLAIFCGAGAGTDQHQRELATRIGEACARRGIGIVYGAGGVGMMGALSDAALSAGGFVTGVIPRALMDREYGRLDLPDLRVVATMHERKQLMYQLADGILVLPGGYGTLDELFEAVTWTQLGLHDKPIVLLGASGYFDSLAGLLDHMLRAGFISEADRRLIRHASTVEEALALLPPENPLILPGQGGPERATSAPGTASPPPTIPSAPQETGAARAPAPQPGAS